MTIPAHIAQTLQDLRLRRDYLDQAIHVLSTIWETPAAPAVTVETPGTTPRIAAAKPTLERRRKARGAAGSDDTHCTTILNAMRKTVRPVSLGELRHETKLSPFVLSGRLKLLARQRQVVITGKGKMTRIALPGSPAKEEP